MKRYNFGPINPADYEQPDGQFVEYSECETLSARYLAEAERADGLAREISYLGERIETEKAARDEAQQCSRHWEGEAQRLITQLQTVTGERDAANIERDRLWCSAIVKVQYQSDCLKLNVTELLKEVERLRSLPLPTQEGGRDG